MGLYFLGTSDFSIIDFSALTSKDTIVVLGPDNQALTDKTQAKLKYVEGASDPDPARGSTDLSAEMIQDGEHLFCCSSHPLLTWPGAAKGARQLFWHQDWPGAYRVINVHPRYWDRPLVSAVEVVHRGELLPELPVRLPDLIYPGTRTSCRVCWTPIDIRYSSGHAWHDGFDLIRAGTDEIIAHQTGPSFIDAPGPYCVQCVEAALYGDGLIVPDGCRYVERHNRSLPVDQELSKHEHPSKWQFTDHPFADACQRYGDDSFEWLLPEERAAARRRVQRAAALLKNFRHAR